MAKSISALYRLADPARFTCAVCSGPLRAQVVRRPCAELPHGVANPIPCDRCAPTKGLQRRRRAAKRRRGVAR